MKTTMKLMLMLLVATDMLLCVTACSQNVQNQMERECESALKQFKTVCDADGGALWRQHLFGPTIFVDPNTRSVVANKQNKANSFVQKGDLFCGQLPEETNLANTSLDYCGERWTCVMWDKGRDAISTTHLLIHESWHRIQNEIGIPPITSQNQHLDVMEGALLMKLELMILEDLLIEKGSIDQHLHDALMVRKYRQTKFPDGNEKHFECHEGLAEYTAYKLLPIDEKYKKGVIAAAIKKGLDADGYCNSFAYLTGPAYGFVLDDMMPNWRDSIRIGMTMQDLLMSRINLPESVDEEDVINLAETYQATEFLQSEGNRLEAQILIDAAIKDRFTTSKWLMIPNNGINFTFNPNEHLVKYDSIGTIYQTMRLSGDFGTIETDNGIMITSDWSCFILPYSEDDQNAQIRLETGYAIEKVDDKVYQIKLK